MEIAAVAAGSNLGDRLMNLAGGVRGVGGLPGSRVVAVSGVTETVAVVPPGAPAGPDFLNAVVLIQTDLSPESLLEALLEIERIHGRDRSREQRWGARTLDLDLLLMGARVVNAPGLTLPHPRMHERRFVLEPLLRVAPEWVHPVRGETVQAMLARLNLAE